MLEIIEREDCTEIEGVLKGIDKKNVLQSLEENLKRDFRRVEEFIYYLPFSFIFL